MATERKAFDITIFTVVVLAGLCTWFSNFVFANARLRMAKYVAENQKYQYTQTPTR